MQHIRAARKSPAAPKPAAKPQPKPTAKKPAPAVPQRQDPAPGEPGGPEIEA